MQGSAALRRRAQAQEKVTLQRKEHGDFGFEGDFDGLEDGVNRFGEGNFVGLQFEAFSIGMGIPPRAVPRPSGSSSSGGAHAALDDVGGVRAVREDCAVCFRPALRDCRLSEVLDFGTGFENSALFLDGGTLFVNGHVWHGVNERQGATEYARVNNAC